jgi:hypothetical protein
MATEELIDIVNQFQLGGEVAHVEKFGSGNINDTYRSILREPSTCAYIHQKISRAVFPRPDRVMENMALVTTHIRKKLWHASPSSRKTTLELIPTKEGQLWYIDSAGEYWRTTVFIPDAVAYDTVQNPKHANEVGKILGEFQRFVADIPPEQLHDTLPGFHHTPIYYDQFLQTMESLHSDPALESRKREPDAVELIQAIQDHEALVWLLMKPYRAGTLCDRVVHNDPKINNILLDERTLQGICILDLDTVKSGLIHFDYGDCLRSASNPVGEEAHDIRQVRFDINIFEQITKGYLEEARAFLSEADVAYLIGSIKVIAFELGTRFFTDYLKGDVYFKVSYPQQNLNRAKVQFTLLKDIEAKETELRKIMERLLQKM